MRSSKQKIRRHCQHGVNFMQSRGGNAEFPSLLVLLALLAMTGAGVNNKFVPRLVEARPRPLRPSSGLSPIHVGIRSAFSRFQREKTLGASFQRSTSNSGSPQYTTQRDDVDESQIFSAFFRETKKDGIAPPHATAEYPMSVLESQGSVSQKRLGYIGGKNGISALLCRQENSSRQEMRPSTQQTEHQSVKATTKVAGGAAAIPMRPLLFWETMVCGAISRSIAQTVMHPANTMKTMLQNSKGPMMPAILELCKPSSFHRLTYGAGTNFLLSVPQGAFNFAVLEYVRKRLGAYVASHPYLEERAESFGFVLDFLSSSVSTITVSVVATPQMMVTDNIMAGNYPNLPQAVKGLYKSGGIPAFYRGWVPGMVGKIPSYALTWTLFQQAKALRDKLTSGRPATNVENSIMGALASTTTVCIMIPLDTIKTRLVVQGGAESISKVPYKGIVDCAARVFREEGIGAFYRGLPPRLVSVVPMIGIQFTVYEAMKRVMLSRDAKMSKRQSSSDSKSKRRKENNNPDESPVTLLEDVEEVALGSANIPNMKEAAFPRAIQK